MAIWTIRSFVTFELAASGKISNCPDTSEHQWEILISRQFFIQTVLRYMKLISVTFNLLKHQFKLDM